MLSWRNVVCMCSIYIIIYTSKFDSRVSSYFKSVQDNLRSDYQLNQSNESWEFTDEDFWAGCACCLAEVEAQGFLNDQVSPSLSLLPAKQKKHELPTYLTLSHALHSLKQTQLHIHLCVQTHTSESHTHTLFRTLIQYTCYEKHCLWSKPYLKLTLTCKTLSLTHSQHRCHWICFPFSSRLQFIHVLFVSFKIHRAMSLFLVTDFLLEPHCSVEA